MSYNTRFFFKFESVNGTEYTINIKQKDYAGAAIQRPLGQAPVLRREENDGICGSSLEIYAECRTDGEYSDLYTSDALEYLAEVVAGTTVVWQGYISPELYSEPDIAPPYDVQIIATDGLGELKLHAFELTGENSLRTILTTLLSYTGLSYGISAITSLAVAEPSAIAASAMLDNVKLDLSHLVGEPCYDVLQSLMSSLHSTIFCHYGEWVVSRETDVAVNGSYIKGYDSTGAEKNFWCRGYGQLGSYDWWPVGQLSSVIIPAKKTISITSDNHYKESALLNSDMSSSSWWVMSNAQYDSNEKAFILPSAGASIRQTISFDDYLAYKLRLTVIARNMGEGSATSNLRVMVKCNGRYQYPQMQTDRDFWRSNDRGSSQRHQLDDHWSLTESFLDSEISAPKNTDTKSNAVTLTFDLPFSESEQYYVQQAKSITIEIKNSDGTYSQAIYGCYLSKAEGIKGFQEVLNLDNGAREEVDDIELGISPLIGSNDFTGIASMMYGIARSTAGNITSWSSRYFSDLDYLAIMSRDYALSYALPRLQKTGIMNKPQSQRVPVAFKDVDGIVYWIQSYDWDLYEDELSLQMISLPSATLEIEDDTTYETQMSGNDSNISSASAGGSSAVGGLSKVGLTTDIAALKFDNNPLTSSGEIQISLNTGYEIPESARIVHNDGTTSAIKKIVVVSEYPSVEESGTLYIKI